MTGNDDHPGFGSHSEAPILAQDRRLELFLDEMVASSPSLPHDFTARVMKARPFAPWEVRQAGPWRAPAAIAAALFVSSAGVFLAPLGDLGPASALAVWGHVVAAAVARPVAAAFSAAPVLASAVEAIRQALSPVGGLALGGAAAAAAGVTAAVLRRRPARAPR